MPGRSVAVFPAFLQGAVALDVPGQTSLFQAIERPSVEHLIPNEAGIPGSRVRLRPSLESGLSGTGFTQVRRSCRSVGSVWNGSFRFV